MRCQFPINGHLYDCFEQVFEEVFSDFVVKDVYNTHRDMDESIILDVEYLVHGGFGVLGLIPSICENFTL